MTVLDVSYAQGQINWQDLLANADVEGVWIRATHGQATDVWFERNALAARQFARPGQWIGYYHFSEYGSGEVAFGPETTFIHLHPADRYCLDAESPCPFSGDTLVKWTRVRLAQADNLPRFNGRQELTWLYSYESFINEHYGTVFIQRPLWVAKVGNGGAPSSTPPHTPYPFSLWQFSWTEHFPGIANAVDGSHVGPAFPGGGLPIPVPSPGGYTLAVRTLVDAKTGSAWTLMEDGGVHTEQGKEFYGAWGNLPPKTREQAQVARFFDFTLRPDGKPGYVIWVQSKAGAVEDYQFPLGA